MTCSHAVFFYYTIDYSSYPYILHYKDVSAYKSEKNTASFYRFCKNLTRGDMTKACHFTLVYFWKLSKNRWRTSMWILILAEYGVDLLHCFDVIYIHFLISNHTCSKKCVIIVSHSLRTGNDAYTKQSTRLSKLSDIICKKIRYN